jgi:tetratricopeptide (TPR) repeat protein
MDKEEKVEKTIFFSYSFKDTEVVDEIDKDFQGFPGIDIKRCVRDIGYTDSIKEFMKKVRDTDFVFIVVSDAFIKSCNCMYEVNELFKEKNFKERILPIVPYENGDVRRTKIFTPEERSEYVIFWNKRREELENKIKNIPRESTNKLDADLKKYREICNIVGEFMDTISDMNYVPLDQLKNDRYKQILRKIGYNETNIESKLLLVSNIEDKEEREIEFDKFILNNPKYFGGYFQKGNIAIGEKKYKAGLYYYTEAINLNPDLAGAYNNRGVALKKIQKYNEALYDYNKAIELKTDFAKAYYNRGVVNTFLLKYIEAMSDYNKAIELQPDFAVAYYGRGFLYTNLEKFIEAIADYKKAVELKPDYTIAYDNLGWSYLELKDYTNAEIIFIKCLDFDKKYFDAVIGLSLLYYKKQNNEESGQWINKAIGIEARLNEGMMGIEKLEKEGLVFYSSENKETLKKIFELIGK